MELVRAWDDGWRMFHVFTGRKWVTVLNCGTMKAKRMLPYKYRNMSPRPITDIPVKRIIRKLKARTNYLHSLDIWHSRGLAHNFAKRWEEQL